jgi:hypothetical protein
MVQEGTSDHDRSKAECKQDIVCRYEPPICRVSTVGGRALIILALRHKGSVRLKYRIAQGHIMQEICVMTVNGW